MKTWQMIKVLTENPEKKFRRVGEDRELYVGVYNNLVAWEGDYTLETRGEPFEIYTDLEWEEVKEPVTFMEAITSGKKISVLCAIETYEGKGKLRDIYYRQPSEMLRALAEYGDEVAIYIILNGKWYIEDWEE